MEMRIGNQPATLKPTGQSADMNKNGKLRKACAEFESIILEKFLTMARESVPKSGLLDGGFAEDMFRSMHDQEMSRQMSREAGMGFGEMLYRQISAQYPGAAAR